MLGSRPVPFHGGSLSDNKGPRSMVIREGTPDDGKGLPFEEEVVRCSGNNPVCE